MGKKLLDFQASISDVKQINPLFSTCKVRVLYTGKNRNMSIITKDAVERALPTLKNIPIVGEYSVENEDFKGHGGAIDLDSFKYIHTTKPYGVVPESATYEWESVKGRDGLTREYLTINGCYLWTGRYEEALSVIENGKGQSMEIEVTDGYWNEEEEAYQINNFIFSALCILGDEVEPAFEDASITAYSLNKDSFKKEFAQMLNELKSLSKEKEVNEVLKELLEKYSLTVEQLTEKGINFNEISEDELEAKIIEVFGIKEDNQNQDDNQDESQNDDSQDAKDDDKNSDDSDDDSDDNSDDSDDNSDDSDDNSDGLEKVESVSLEEYQKLQAELESLLKTNAQLEEEIESLKEFKLKVERKEHEENVQKLFKNFQLTESDVEGLDIHAFSLEEIEEKCYAILGKKLATKKNFSKNDEGGIRLPIIGGEDQEDKKPYGGLFEKYLDKE